MTTKHKEQISIMRSSGCSYNQIASLLQLPKSTVASYCQKNNLIPQDNTNGDSSDHNHYFLLCKECGELFMPKTNRAQEFCSSKCRVAYWRKEKAKQDEEAKLMREIQELEECYEPVMVGSLAFYDSPKGLDFLPEESDELVRRKRE